MRTSLNITSLSGAKDHPFGSQAVTLLVASKPRHCIQRRVFSSAAYRSDSYRHGFNGKEKETDGTTDNYDFGARIYDGRLGRWMAVDPHFQNYRSISVFVYCSNNPLIYIDPSGMDIIITTAFKNSTYYPFLKYLMENQVALGINKNFEHFLQPTSSSEQSDLTFHYDYITSVKNSNHEDIYTNAQSSQNNLLPQFITSTFSAAALTESNIENSSGAGDYFLYEKSDLAKLVTVANEILHVDLSDNSLRDENKMATQVATISKIVENYATSIGINLPTDAIEALSWEGLEETPAFASKFGQKDLTNPLYKKYLENIKIYGRIVVVENVEREVLDEKLQEITNKNLPSEKNDSEGIASSDDTEAERIKNTGNEDE